MLRTLFILIALLILIVIGLVAVGYVDFGRSGDGGVRVETRDVKVGTTTRDVELPVVRTETRQIEVPAVGLEKGEPAPANGQ